MTDGKDEREDFRIYKPTYIDPKTKERKEMANYYIQFRDHLNTRWRWPAYASERQTHKLAEWIIELVGVRRMDRDLDERQTRFVESLSDDLRAKLIKASIIHPQPTIRGGVLLAHLE